MVEFKKHFGQSASIQVIPSGASVPIGGKAIYSDELDISVIADFDKLQDSVVEGIDKSRKLGSQEHIPKVAAWLESCGIDVPASLWVQVFCFQKHILESKFPNFSENAGEKRRNLYIKDKAVFLSDILSLKAAECSEIAILGKYFLDQLGVKNELFIGAHALPDQEFSNAHAFILFSQDDGGALIWDPSNPVDTDQGNMPALSGMDRETFERWKKDREKGSSYVALKNKLTSGVDLYGVTNGGYITQEQIIYPQYGLV